MSPQRKEGGIYVGIKQERMRKVNKAERESSQQCWRSSMLVVTWIGLLMGMYPPLPAAF
jgi:hypothetical protein